MTATTVRSTRPAGALQRRVHGLLDGRAEAGDRLDVVCYYALLGAIVLALAVMVLDTIPSVGARWGVALAVLDLALGAVFLIEYVARVWTAPVDPRYADGWRGRLRFMRSPLALFDLAAVVALLLPHLAFDLRQARLVRLFALLRVGKLGRANRSIAMAHRIFTSRRDDLLMAAGAVGSLLLVGSTLVYFAEHDAQPDKFGSIPEALWWGIATVTTVGYGDVYPITMAGRVLGGCLAVAGIASFALPTAILGAAFLDELQRARAADPHAPCPTCGLTRADAARPGEVPPPSGTP
ncbi:MAG: ion transporter [Gemmatirosa sp.]